jgi:hypothetical protein
VVAVVVGEAEPVPEPERPGAVRLDLEVRGRGALLVGPPGERAHDGGGQPPAPLPLRDLHRAQQRPGPVDDGTAYRPGRRGEPHRGTAADHLQRRLGQLPGTPVGAQPVPVGGPRQHDPLSRQVQQRRERRGAYQGVGLAGPAGRLGRRRVRRGVRHLEAGRQPACGVPARHLRQRLRRRHPGVPDRQRGIRPPGETAGRAQGPVAQRRRLGGRPGPGRDLLQFPWSHVRHPGQPARRGGRHHFPGHQRRFRDPHRFPGPPCDAHHSRIPRCENTDRIGEHRMPVGDLDQLPYRYAFAHVSGGDPDLEPRSGREFPWHACPSCSDRAQERRY